MSAISRSLKVLARDLEVRAGAVTASRAVEQRHDKRPILSDLRDGMPDRRRPRVPARHGTYAPIRDLVGQSGIRVLAVNRENWRLEPRPVTKAFATGRKPVYRLTTRLGHTIRATGNHKFLAFDGWRRLDDMAPGMRLAVPRRLEVAGRQSLTNSELALLGHLIGDGCTLPRHAIQYTSNDREPRRGRPPARRRSLRRRCSAADSTRARLVPDVPELVPAAHARRPQPVAEWLDNLGAFGLRAPEKRADAVFAQPWDGIARFLRHLWATDGTLMSRGVYPVVRYHSSSERLATDVQSLLLRLGIVARRHEVSMGTKGLPSHHVSITGSPTSSGSCPSSARSARVGECRAEIIARLAERPSNTNRDTIPREAWRRIVVPAMTQAGVTSRQLQHAIDTRYCGTALYESGLGRERALRVAAAGESDELAKLGMSDVYWDEIATLEPDGEEDVYDLTVDGLHSFVANDILVHNSLEQDADLVFFIYRDEYYDAESDQQGLAEVHLAKHRNGPTGTAKLTFLKRFAKFADLAGG